MDAMAAHHQRYEDNSDNDLNSDNDNHSDSNSTNTSVMTPTSDVNGLAERLTAFAADETDGAVVCHRRQLGQHHRGNGTPFCTRRKEPK